MYVFMCENKDVDNDDDEINSIHSIPCHPGTVEKRPLICHVEYVFDLK